MNHLKLITTDPPDAVYEKLKPHLAQGLLPADAALLVLLVPGLPSGDALVRALHRLVASGRLRRVLIGSEPHLLDGEQAVRRSADADHEAPPPVASPEPPPAPPLAPAETSTNADMDFELEVAIDVETERGVLWRVALVVAALAALALLRQWLLIGLSAG